jgi:hypothetical protein
MLKTVVRMLGRPTFSLALLPALLILDIARDRVSYPAWYVILAVLLIVLPVIRVAAGEWQVSHKDEQPKIAGK